MIKIFGHRGCRGVNNPPENSLAAFEAAITQGADGIEFDVFATNDNQLVVFHDKLLEDRTNGSGKITAKTLAQLKTLQLKKNGSEALSDQTIPTLDEVLDLVNAKAKPDFVLNIEMKGPGISEQLADVLRKRLMQNWKRENFLVSSFDLIALEDFNKDLPAISIGALFAGRAPTWDISENMLQKKLPSVAHLRPSTVNLSLPSMTPHVIEAIRKIGAKPVAWTANELPPSQLSEKDRAHLVNFLAHGHIFITDYPAEIRTLAGG